MKLCVECNAKQPHKPSSSLCEECFDKLLKEKAKEIDISNQENKWF